jgi:hypothetical protein
MTNQEAKLAYEMLEIIDASDGVPLMKMEEVLTHIVSFRSFCLIINYLWRKGLIKVDSNHVAWRVS